MEIWFDAYQLADTIKDSEEVRNYLDHKQKVGKDLKAQEIIRQFNKKKVLFEEAMRFGIFHPNYHQAKEEVQRLQEEMKHNESIQAYLEAEKQLDFLLYNVSVILAHAVSEEVKVPGNYAQAGQKRGCQCKK